jgi:hypothetical protein
MPISSTGANIAGGDELDVLFGTANPNPERVGCLPTETLAALARRARPMDDPAYIHLTECSPCYREFRELQHKGTASSASGPRRSRAARGVAAAAVLFGPGDRGMAVRAKGRHAGGAVSTDSRIRAST